MNPVSSQSGGRPASRRKRRGAMKVNVGGGGDTMLRRGSPSSARLSFAAIILLGLTTCCGTVLAEEPGGISFISPAATSNNVGGEEETFRPLRRKRSAGLGDGGATTNYQKRQIQLLPRPERADAGAAASGDVVPPPPRIGDPFKGGVSTVQNDRTWLEVDIEDELFFGRELFGASMSMSMMLSMSMPIEPPTPKPTKPPVIKTESPVGKGTDAPVSTPGPTPRPSSPPVDSPPTPEPTESQPTTPEPVATPSPVDTPTGSPVAAPVDAPTEAPLTIATEAPTEPPIDSLAPTPGPSVSNETSTPPPTESPEASPTTPEPVAPTPGPSVSNETSTPPPTESPEASPTTPEPVAPPTAAPTPDPSPEPTTPEPSAPPVDDPTPEPAPQPTVEADTLTPTPPPTTDANATCGGLSPEERQQGIFDELSTVTDPTVLIFPRSPQGMAYRWLVDDDDLRLCPDSPSLIQRYVLATLYYSTDGDDAWLECSADDIFCGINPFSPFFGQVAYLSPVSECEWAGSRCRDDGDGDVTTIDSLALYENGLDGPLPPEMTQLAGLVVVRLDGNELVGSLPSDVSESWTALRRLNIAANELTGQLDAIASLPEVRVLQLQNNQFSGEIPSEFGEGGTPFLRTALFHGNNLVGTMPEPICDNVVPLGSIKSLTADCKGPRPEVECDCCTDCFR